MRKNHRLHFHKQRYSVHPVNEGKNLVTQCLLLSVLSGLLNILKGYTLYNSANSTHWFRAIKDNIKELCCCNHDPYNYIIG